MDMLERYKVLRGRKLLQSYSHSQEDEGKEESYAGRTSGKVGKRREGHDELNVVLMEIVDLFETSCLNGWFKVAQLLGPVVNERKKNLVWLAKVADGNESTGMMQWLDANGHFDSFAWHSILKFASKFGHDNLLKFVLLKMGRDLDEEKASRAFRMAAKNGHLECVKRLLETNQAVANSGTKGSPCGGSNGCACLICLRSGWGDDLTMKNYALRHASKNGHFHVVRFLLTHPVVVRERADTFSIPLTFALLHEQIDIVLKLLGKTDVRIEPAHLKQLQQTSIAYGVTNTLLTVCRNLPVFNIHSIIKFAYGEVFLEASLSEPDLNSIK